MLLDFCVLFFKQKTAYEMRISDWSSDVCSSDLLLLQAVHQQANAGGVDRVAHHVIQALDAMGHAQAHRHVENLFGQFDRAFHLRRTAGQHDAGRDTSEERRVGNEGLSTCRSRWSRYT